MACSALQLISTQRADHRRHAQVLVVVLVGADQRDGRHADVAARAGLVVVRRGLVDRLGLLDVIHHAFFAPLAVDALPAAPQGFPIKIYSDLGWLRRLVAACRPHEQIWRRAARKVRGYIEGASGEKTPDPSASVPLAWLCVPLRRVQALYLAADAARARRRRRSLAHSPYRFRHEASL